jgi:hypothetical protein
MLGFPWHYFDRPSSGHEWLLSTLFDASLLSTSAAVNGGSFFFRLSRFGTSGVALRQRSDFAATMCKHW